MANGFSAEINSEEKEFFNTWMASKGGLSNQFMATRNFRF